MRKEISTHTPSEERVGYSRAVRIDNRIYFSGTTSADEEGKTVGTDVYGQSKFIFGRIGNVLAGEGFTADHIARVTAYLVDMQQISGFDRAFKENFADSKPACTLVGVKELVAPDLLIEIECIADKS